MAWNKPSAENAVTAKIKGGQKGVRLGHGLVAAAIVVIGAAAAWWYLGKDVVPAPITSHKAPRPIREVKPAVVSNRVASTVAKTNAAPRRWPGTRETEGNTGYSKIDYGRIETNFIDKAHQRIEDRLFVHTADRKIARLLMVEPGTEIITFGSGDELYRDFDRKFLRSLKTPIIISKDDTEEEKALKRAVREAKIDMKARLDAGESLEKLMTDTRKQLQEIGLYRKELQAEVQKIARNREITEADMEDYVKAANTMLEARGSKPISMPSIFKARMELKRKHGISKVSTDKDNNGERKK